MAESLLFSTAGVPTLSFYSAPTLAKRIKAAPTVRASSATRGHRRSCGRASPHGAASDCAGELHKVRHAGPPPAVRASSATRSAGEGIHTGGLCKPAQPETRLRCVSHYAG
jgi:hypothetical protein